MGILSKDALLGASDLREREIDLTPFGIDGSVKVRSLPAAYSNQASSEALELVTNTRGEQTAKVNTAKLEELQVLHGLIDPQLSSVDEVRAFSQKVGSSWRAIVNAIDELSGVDKEAIERANAMFQLGGRGKEVPASNGSAGGDGGSDLHARAGVGASPASGGDV